MEENVLEIDRLKTIGSQGKPAQGSFYFDPVNELKNSGVIVFLNFLDHSFRVKIVFKEPADYDYGGCDDDD
jgi:hypothetical protein